MASPVSYQLVGGLLVRLVLSVDTEIWIFGEIFLPLACSQRAPSALLQVARTEHIFVGVGGADSRIFNAHFAHGTLLHFTLPDCSRYTLLGW